MIVTRTDIGSEAAMRLVTDAIEYAGLRRWNVSVAVVDTNGSVLALRRMDHASAPIADFALDKAFTAATMKSATSSYSELMNASESLKLGMGTRSRLLPWGGGLPLYHNGSLVGAIGVSGAQDYEDIECAKAAIAQAGLDFDRGDA